MVISFRTPSGIRTLDPLIKSQLLYASLEPDCCDISVCWRFLADSNRRTRFCRPLTKPLIQGTRSSLFLICEVPGGFEPPYTVLQTAD